MSKDRLKSEMVKNLKKSSSTKEKLDPEVLFNLTANVKFFQKITEEHKSSEIHRECCEVMTIENFEKNDVVIHFGDIGEKFYIILTGSATILIPSKKKLKITIQEFIDYQKRFKSSSSESLSSSHSSGSDSHIFNNDLQENKKSNPVSININDISIQFNYPNKSNDSADEESMIQKLFKKKLIKEKKKEILKLAKQSNQDFIEFDVNRMEETGILKEGDSFGEYALISNRPRAATVVAREHLVLLVLKKSQFKSILGSLSEKKTAVHIKFFQSLQYFSNLSNNALSKLTYLFQIQQFSNKQVLFAQDQPTNGLYFIKEGEFMLTQRCYKENPDKKAYDFQSSQDRPSDKWVKLPRIKKDLKVIIKGKNESVGGFEVLRLKSHRMFTCTCISGRSEVYFLPIEHFWTKIPNVDQIKILLEQENIRLANRLLDINEISTPTAAVEVPIDIRSKRQLLKLRNSPKIEASQLSGRINSVQLYQKPLKIDDFSSNTPKLTNLPSSPTRPKHYFHKLTDEEVFQAVNGRFHSRIEKPRQSKSFVKTRSPPRSFWLNYRKNNNL